MSGLTALIEAAREAGATLRPRLWVESLDRLGPELRDALRRREAEVIRVLMAPKPADDGDEVAFDPDLSIAAEPDPIAEAEHAALAAEPVLPAPGTPERHRLYAQHAAALAGYRQAALRRPPSWADPDALPSAGCRCSCCGGQSWWCEAVSPKGWRCSACHPWPRSWPVDAVREMRT